MTTHSHSDDSFGAVFGDGRGFDSAQLARESAANSPEASDGTVRELSQQSKPERLRGYHHVVITDAVTWLPLESRLMSADEFDRWEMGR